MQIQDKLFVVTGAGSGLGAAVTHHLCCQGASVVAVDLNPDAVVTTCAAFSTQVFPLAGDVTSVADAERIFLYIAQNFQSLAGLVNCAGIAPAAKVLGRKGVLGMDTFEQVIRVNLLGSFNMLRLAAEQMSRNTPDEGGERGVIINTASVAAFEGQVGQAAYAASKAGIVGMTLPLAREFARHAIRVMTIAPGIMATAMMAAMPQDVQTALGASVPFPARMGEAKEFALLVAHIIENAYLNGETIRLDGALRMS